MIEASASRNVLTSRSRCCQRSARTASSSGKFTVYISGTALAVTPESLPPEIAAARENNGRNIVFDLLGLDDPPSQVMATTAGLSRVMPD